MIKKTASMEDLEHAKKADDGITVLCETNYMTKDIA